MAEGIREFADFSLMQINQATLTDAEASMLPTAYDEGAILSAVAKVINSRGGTGNAFKKLRAFATLRGVEISTKKKEKSNILIGMVLE